jgi:hypothetical protein
VSNWLTKVKRAHIAAHLGSFFIGVGTVITALLTWPGTIEQGLETWGYKKPEAYVLAEKSEKGDLVRQMAQLISRRWFWTERFLEDFTRKFPDDIQAETWTGYQEAVAAWNDNYLLLMMLTDMKFTKGGNVSNLLTDIGENSLILIIV